MAQLSKGGFPLSRTFYVPVLIKAKRKRGDAVVGVVYKMLPSCFPTCTRKGRNIQGSDVSVTNINIIK